MEITKLIFFSEIPLVSLLMFPNIDIIPLQLCHVLFLLVLRQGSVKQVMPDLGSDRYKAA